MLANNVSSLTLQRSLPPLKCDSYCGFDMNWNYNIDYCLGNLIFFTLSLPDVHFCVRQRVSKDCWRNWTWSLLHQADQQGWGRNGVLTGSQQLCSSFNSRLLPKLTNEQRNTLESWISDMEMKGSIIPLEQMKSWTLTNTQQCSCSI